MTEEQGGAAQAAANDASTIPDGSGGVIARTAPSTSGETFAGGTIVENDVGESFEELMAAIEETIKPFDEGDLVSGTVVKIDKDEVLLDIGYKSEGVIPSRELSIRNDVDPSEVVSNGDQIEALVLQKEDKEGRLILSKKRAQYERAWGKIEEIKNAEGTVTGPVIEVVKGGLIIDIGLRGFLPASLVEMRRVRDLQPYVGKELECRIIELDKNRNNVVLSRRKFLEESQAEQRQDFLTSLAKGERRTGVVSSIVNFGAFVDLGGVDGLVHVSELSWKHVDHPSEVVEVGQEVDVEVLDVDLERERVSLSLKATQEDPWRQFARRHEVGDVIEGRVTKLVPFGAFVEVDDAIEGLVHISELADHHVERAEDEVGVHDRVPVKIIDIDLDRRRISLSRKQAMRSDEAIGIGPDTPSEAPTETAPAEEAVPESEFELENEAAAGGEVTREEAPGMDSSAAAAAAPAGAGPTPAGSGDPTLGGAAGSGDPALGGAVPDAVDAEPAQQETEEPALDPGIDPDAAPTPAEDGAAPGSDAPRAVEDEEPGADASIESIVQDLKRERGQS
jgi:small subunit ribosomal protein S1